MHGLKRKNGQEGPAFDGFPVRLQPNHNREQRLLFITARLEQENELNIHEHAVFVNKEPGQLHYGEQFTEHEQT